MLNFQCYRNVIKLTSSRHFSFLFFPSIGYHFSGMSLKKGINFRFLHPQIGSGFKNLGGTPLSENYGSTPPPPGIYRAMELSKCRKASLEVSKFGFHFLAVIRIALDNRRVVHSKAHFVAFKTVMSIFFGSEYSLTYLLFILSSIRSISIEKEQFIKPKGW